MEGIGITDLKVADLRKELEKRNKDKTGVKHVLLDRLKEVLEEDGHDPQLYRFKPGDDSPFEYPNNHHSTLNGNSDGSEKVGQLPKAPSTQEISDDSTNNGQLTEKKMNDETVPYVVQVGEQEEDLDYDIKNESSGSTQVIGVQNEVLDSKINEPSKHVGEAKQDSGNVIEQQNESSCNLWVSNLPQSAKAVELKQHFAKAGKVIAATIVVSTREPSGCYGFIQMATAADASEAASLFDSTDFYGYKLRVEATDRKPPGQSANPIDRPKVSSRSKTLLGVSSSRRATNMDRRRRLLISRRIELRRIAIKNAIAREERKKAAMRRYNRRSIRYSLAARRSLPHFGSKMDTIRYLPRSNLRRTRHEVIRKYRKTNSSVYAMNRQRDDSHSFNSRALRETSRTLAAPEKQLFSRSLMIDRPYHTPQMDIDRSRKPIWSDTQFRYGHESSSRNFHAPTMDESSQWKHSISSNRRSSRMSPLPRVYEADRNPRDNHPVSMSRQPYLGSRFVPPVPRQRVFHSYHDDLHKPPLPHSAASPSSRYKEGFDNQRNVILKSSTRPRFDDYRREFRAVSRSPPRSRDSTVIRPYPNPSPDFNRHHNSMYIRGRSPTSSQRPESLDLGTRPGRRDDWLIDRRSRIAGPPMPRNSVSHLTRPFNSFPPSTRGFNPRGRGRRYP